MNGLHYYLQLGELAGLLEIPGQHLPQLLHVILADVVGVQLHDVAHHHHVHPGPVLEMLSEWWWRVEWFDSLTILINKDWWC